MAKKYLMAHNDPKKSIISYRNRPPHIKKNKDLKFGGWDGIYP